MRPGRRLPLVIAAVLCLSGATGLAAQDGADQEAPSTYDRIWSWANLYTGDEASAVQSVDLSGRVQLDLAWVDSGDDDHGELNVRRFRFGVKTRFLRQLTLHVEAEFNPQEADPVYTRLTDAYLAWSRGPAVRLTLGKHSAGFTLDGMTSSKQLLTIDRSALSNNIWFTDEYIPGLSLQGERGVLLYHVGLFSSGNEDPEFGDFTGGQFVLATVGWDFATGSGAQEALLRLNFVDNEPDPDNGFTRPLERIGSLNFSFARDGWGVRADLSVATGYFDQSDLWGFYVMPYRDLPRSLQLVGRYTHVASDEANGVRFGRYESTLVDGRGDRYDEVYLGLNAYWYGHKLKLQNGAQYVEMRDRAADGGDYSGWAWTTALRLSW